MNCLEARNAMLVADSSELRGGEASPPTPLTLHLESCGTCRTKAAALSRDIGRLAVAVIDASARRRRRHRAGMLIAVPIAASIVAIVAVVARRAAAPRAERIPSSAVVSVDVARGQQAAVFSTSDPNVTVVWLSPGGAP